MLPTNSPGCGAQLLIRDIRRPQPQYTRFFRGQVVALATGQRVERCLELLSSGVDAPIALAARQIGGHIQAVIDDTEVAVVVQYAFIGRITGKDCHPEVDVRLQLGGFGKCFACLQGPSKEEPAKNPAETRTCLLFRFRFQSQIID